MHAIRPFFSRTRSSVQRDPRCFFSCLLTLRILGDIRNLPSFSFSSSSSSYFSGTHIVCERRNLCLSRNDKYYVSSGRPDAGSLGPQRYFNPHADGHVIARTHIRGLLRYFLFYSSLRVRISRDHII